MKLQELMHLKGMQAFLRERLGNAIQVSHVKAAKRLPDYLVLLVSLQGTDQRLVVKAAGPLATLSSQFERTAALHTLVARQTSIRMPEIFVADVSQRVYPWRYLVKAYLPGVSLAQARSKMSSTEIANAFEQLGKAVGDLHQVQFPAFGELDSDLQLTLALNFLPALRARAELVITKPQLRDFFLAALAERQSWFDGLNAACLVHEDLHAYNLLFHHSATGWQLSTILDFDKAWAGSSESDLAKLEFWRGMVHPQFWEAYNRIATIQESYQQRKVLYQLLWCLEYAEPTELHLNDTQTVCRLLGIPAIQNF